MSLLPRAALAILLPIVATAALTERAGAQPKGIRVTGKGPTALPVLPKLVVPTGMGTASPGLQGTGPIRRATRTAQPVDWPRAAEPLRVPRAAAPASGRSGPPPYWSFVAVPAACLAGSGSEQVSAACNVTDAAVLIRDMRNAPDYPSAARRVIEGLRGEAQKRLIVAFAGKGVEARVDVVRSLYQAEAAFFDYMTRSIQAELVDHPARIAAATAEARRDAYRIVALRAAIAAETPVNVQVASSYLREHPETSQVVFNCSLACHQLIGVARGLNLFDSR